MGDFGDRPDIPATAHGKPVVRCTTCKRLFPEGTARCPDHEGPLAPADPLLGKVIGATFRLDGKLGKGGMGGVYLARHFQLPGTFAVKILSPRYAQDQTQVTRFLRECEAQSRIVHDNCVRVFDYGHDDKHDVYFVGMEHVRGRTLKQELKRTGPMPPDRVVELGLQILDALAAAHAVGVLHCDLKPGNVMITEAGGVPDRVRVFDFAGKPISHGEEKHEAATRLTMPGTLFGTPAYMSPEQARGEDLDERSDLYAAAVVMLHLLMGRSPFRGRDIGETLSRVIQMQPPRPSLLRRDADTLPPPGLEVVLMKALSKDRDLRFKDANSFSAALKRFARLGLGRPVTPPSGTPALHLDRAPTLMQARLDLSQIELPDDDDGVFS